MELLAWSVCPPLPRHHNNNIDYVTPPQGLKTEDDHKSWNKSMWALVRVTFQAPQHPKNATMTKMPAMTRKA